MDKEVMKVVYVEPHCKPTVVEIEHSLEAEQELVKGNIEVCYFRDDEDVCLICNEEGKLLGMEGNRRTDAGIIAGPFFICGTTEDDFRSLTEEEISKYMEKFDEVEDITPEEVQADMDFGFLSM